MISLNMFFFFFGGGTLYFRVKHQGRGGERHCESKFQEHNTITSTRARTRTTRPGVQRANVFIKTLKLKEPSPFLDLLRPFV